MEAIKHPVFMRKMGDNRTVIMAIIDSSMVKDFPANDSFTIARTERGPHTADALVLTLWEGDSYATEDYIEEIEKQNGAKLEPTLGKGIGGILTDPYWFVKKAKSVLKYLRS